MMFARAASIAIRRSPRQQIRQYASPSTEPQKSKAVLYAAAILGVAVAGGTYYFTSGMGKALPPAEITLKGDDQWIDLKLVGITPVTHNTKKFRFELPSENHVSGLKTASALLTKFQGPEDKKPVIRPYTPINDEGARGYMELLIKRYEGGPMSSHIHGMTVDQTLSFKGPIPKYEWTPNKHDQIALIAGGTGITPMYQLMRAIFSNPDDKTKVTLIVGNLSEDDVLLKQELAHFENTYPQRFRALYILDKAPKTAGWATQGRVTKELLKTSLPEPGSGNYKIFVCGPPGLYKAVSGTKISPKDQGELAGMLKDLGYKKEDVFKF